MWVIFAVVALFGALLLAVNQFHASLLNVCFARQVRPVRTAIERFREANGSLPKTLADLPSDFVEPQALQDAHGHTYHFERVDASYRISPGGPSASGQTDQVFSSEGPFVFFADFLSTSSATANLFIPESCVCKGSCW